MNHLTILLTHAILIMFSGIIAYGTIKDIIEAKKELRELRKYTKK